MGHPRPLKQCWFYFISSITRSTDSWRGCIYIFTMLDSHCLYTNGQGLVFTKKQRRIFSMLILYDHHNTTTDVWGLRMQHRGILSAGEHSLGSPQPITEQEQTVPCLPENSTRGSQSLLNSQVCGCH